MLMSIIYYLRTNLFMLWFLYVHRVIGSSQRQELSMQIFVSLPLATALLIMGGVACFENGHTGWGVALELLAMIALTLTITLYRAAHNPRNRPQDRPQDKPPHEPSNLTD
jgi:hypothetical protein